MTARTPSSSLIVCAPPDCCLSGGFLAAAATQEVQAAGDCARCSLVVKAAGVCIELPRALWHSNGMEYVNIKDYLLSASGFWICSS